MWNEIPRRSTWLPLSQVELREPLVMKFRLTYDGPVISSQPLPREVDAALSAKQIKISNNKHLIRKRFHKQLKFLWANNPVLKRLQFCESCGISQDLVSHPSSLGIGNHKLADVQQYIVGQVPQFTGFKFCPLVIEQFDLICSIDLLILRRMRNGVFEGGDIDNRVKTIIDALKMPQQRSQLGDSDKSAPGEDPFYVLLRDDSLINGFSVETDMLLREESHGDEDHRMCKVIVSVELRPNSPTMFNLAFA